jgi:hypothetical protein
MRLQQHERIESRKRLAADFIERDDGVPGPPQGIAERCKRAGGSERIGVPSVDTHDGRRDGRREEERNEQHQQPADHAAQSTHAGRYQKPAPAATRLRSALAAPAAVVYRLDRWSPPSNQTD